LDDHAVYLVPIGRRRFDLYAEPSPEAEAGDEEPHDAGFWERQAGRFRQGWRDTSRNAYAARGATNGVLARTRDWLVRQIAESIAEQQTLWSLRDRTAASFVYPAELSEMDAAGIRDRILVEARRRHRFWMLIHLAATVLTVALVLLPGPNLIGYYFAFRLIAHFLSWRGARRALSGVSWGPRAETALTDLGHLADVPRSQRAAQVSDIAAQLGLPHLESFFDRATAAKND
jgi:hypothetical protein